MALPLDNPSYFIVANGTLPCSKGKFRLFKKRGSPDISDIPPFRPNQRMRTLLRSVSSNSADSNQELLVLGEPRPSDIAPKNPFVSPRKQRQKSRIDELTYSPLATSEEAADEIFYSEEEEEEVFLSEDSAKYYNVSAKPNGRRHSIGTYLLERERTLSVASSQRSYREDQPAALVHATMDGEVVKTSSTTLEVVEPRVEQTRPRRKCTRCRGTSCASSCAGTMDDIVIVSSRDSQAAGLWVNYFGTCFEQISKQKNRPNIKVFQLGIEEITSPTISASLEQRITSVKLHIIIVCPSLLQYISNAPGTAAALCSLFKPERTIAMLLGVTDDDITDVQHQGLVSYKQWKRHQVGQDQDQDFARDFLQAAVGILTKVAKQQQQQALEERTTFSVMPKKVKQSQNRLVVLLAEPLGKDDVVRISVDRNGDMIEVKSVKRRNPYTLKFTMPDRCLEVSSIVNVVVEKNGDVLGARPVKCESRLRELDQILRTVNDPVEFMCQTLGFSPSNADQLDLWMVHAFQKNLPPHFNLIAGSGLPGGSKPTDGPSTPARHPHGHEEFPTLLHFAAKFGLEKLAWQLLECPGAEAACELRNANDLTPTEIADNAGHIKLASALKGYMQMSEFTNMYSQLKELSFAKQQPQQPTRTQPPPDVDEDEYLLPRSADMTYSIPPPARPVSPLPASVNQNGPLTGYLEMQSPKNPTGRTTPISRKNSLSKQTQPDQISNGSSSKAPTPLPTEPSERSETTVNYEDKVQGELLEIINDFKNNVFSLSEVEQLVENWRKRNDVQKSFKEKEDQLNAMRREYERIQQVMKEEMKRPTPFDRIKKLFVRRTKPQNQITTITRDLKLENSYMNGDDKASSDTASSIGQSNLRPISSLSLQSTASTSSSGRMSTLSGCSAASFGDSGTHSDHEDRKHLMRQTSSDHEYFEISETSKKSSPNFNYLIPPTPKPVYNKYNPLKQAPVQQFSTINERPPHPVPRVDTPTETEGDQYYIQFPPSGLPVTGSPAPVAIPEDTANEYLAMEEPMTEYINVTVGGDKPDLAIKVVEPELPEYINYQPQLSPPPALPPRKE